MNTTGLEFLRRIATMVAGPVGVTYLAMWALALVAMNGGGPLASDPGCVSLDMGPTPMWYCSGSIFDWYLANLVNAALLATVWTGACFLPGSDATVATPLLLLHAAGLPCAIYAAGQTIARLADFNGRRVSFGSPAL